MKDDSSSETKVTHFLRLEDNLVLAILCILAMIHRFDLKTKLCCRCSSWPCFQYLSGYHQVTARHVTCDSWWCWHCPAQIVCGCWLPQAWYLTFWPWSVTSVAMPSNPFDSQCGMGMMWCKGEGGGGWQNGDIGAVTQCTSFNVATSAACVSADARLFAFTAHTSPCVQCLGASGLTWWSWQCESLPWEGEMSTMQL